MSLLDAILHRSAPPNPEAPTPDPDPRCWVCLNKAGRRATGITTMCDTHARGVRDTATAQARPGYGLPITCGACGTVRMPHKRHDCPAVRDEARHLRRADV